MKRYFLEPLFLLVLAIGCTGYPENKPPRPGAPSHNVDVDVKTPASNHGDGVKVRAPGVKVDVQKGKGVDVEVKPNRKD